ncbi:MAG: phosphoribosylglycinamide formyltransferase [Bacteroidetes bacterium GWF2_38_335]|nr:MAG: phosphoribosylglycinamide formyltransferase [Bacteroidetes bacterium GWF2_38_335]OFY80329.1 MAG: phosphoribosylglycinamide formyltransferase [Bacteroidetes bacterium RIFOXYA12_FULL_38_20]HBS88870.1 phosphoribosylglycinamide formyltransferase [Bacteroidales bacterium]
MKKIVIFASGSGTNAENIAKHFLNTIDTRVTLILSNKQDAYVFERAKKLSIPAVYFEKHDFYQSDKVINIIRKEDPSLIVLAGFLWLIPSELIRSFEGRIINIHPALLPKYGGKGMYGDAVHRAVVENGEKETGITIHFVNEVYDEGKIIFQAKCLVHPSDTPEIVAQKVHELEYEHFPRVIEGLLKG